MKKIKIIWVIGIAIGIFYTSCKEESKQALPGFKDNVNTNTLKQVRLGDGVPLNIKLSIRWRIEDVKKFSEQFNSPNQYDSLILQAREKEIACNISNNFLSVDSVFTVSREKYIDQIKSSFLQLLGEDGITIKEVIVSDIIFPKSFTDAMEQVGLKERELELIRQRNIIAMENAKSEEEQAKADGKVSIAKAEVDGKVSQINAETEKKRRLSLIAKAETETRVSEINAEAEAKRLKILAKAEAERKQLLADVDVEKQKDLKDLEMQKQKERDKLEFAKEMDG